MRKLLILAGAVAALASGPAAAQGIAKPGPMPNGEPTTAQPAPYVGSLPVAASAGDASADVTAVVFDELTVGAPVRDEYGFDAGTVTALRPGAVTVTYKGRTRKVPPSQVRATREGLFLERSRLEVFGRAN